MFNIIFQTCTAACSLAVDDKPCSQTCSFTNATNSIGRPQRATKLVVSLSTVQRPIKKGKGICIMNRSGESTLRLANALVRKGHHGQATLSAQIACLCSMDWSSTRQHKKWPGMVKTIDQAAQMVWVRKRIWRRRRRDVTRWTPRRELVTWGINQSRLCLLNELHSINPTSNLIVQIRLSLIVLGNQIVLLAIVSSTIMLNQLCHELHLSCSWMLLKNSGEQRLSRQGQSIIRKPEVKDRQQMWSISFLNC